MMMIKKNHTSSLRMSNRFEQEVVASDTYELMTDLFCHLLRMCIYVLCTHRDTTLYYVGVFSQLTLG